MAITTSPGQVVPDFAPNALHPHVDSVTLTDNTFNSVAVIALGDSFFLRLDMAVDGRFNVIWPRPWNATVFLQRIDAPGQVTLGPTAFTWNPGVTILNLGPFPTGRAAGQVPEGIWRIVVDLDPQARDVAAVVGAFIDGPVVEVIA